MFMVYQKTSKEREEEINVKILILEKQIEESKTRETQLKQDKKVISVRFIGKDIYFIDNKYQKLDSSGRAT